MTVEAAAPEAPALENIEETRSLIDEILAETRVQPADDRYGDMKRGLRAALGEVTRPGREGEVVDRALVDLMLSVIDAAMARQIDEILHYPAFQRLEAAWRGMKFLVDRTDFRENIRVEFLNCSKEDLLA